MQGASKPYATTQVAHPGSQPCSQDKMSRRERNAVVPAFRKLFAMKRNCHWNRSMIGLWYMRLCDKIVPTKYYSFISSFKLITCKVNG